MTHPNTRRFCLASCLFAIVLTLTGCGGSGPGATVEKFYNAMNDGEITQATGLLSKQMIQGGDAKIRTLLTEGAKEMKDKHKGLSSVDIDSEEVQGELATVKVTLHYEDDTSESQTHSLVKEDGAWKINLTGNK